MKRNALFYAQELVAFDSVSTRSNVAIIDYLQRVLDELGFETERIDYVDPEGVPKANLVAKRGTGYGGLAYIGHTDVVPEDNWSWKTGPFQPEVFDGRLYGRGSCDMKGPIACMLAAAERTIDRPFRAPIYFVLTADEEVGYRGAAEVATRSQLFREMVKHGTKGVIGEPTGLQVVYAHKGGVWLEAVSHGRAAHSSTTEGLNANLAMIPYLVEMKRLYDETETSARWRNEEFDPPTVRWNIGINDFTRAVNMTPARSVCTVYFRPMPGQNAEELVERAKHAAERQGLEFRVRFSAPPFRVDPDSEYVRKMLELAGQQRPTTVAYGTDGARLRELKQLVVCGPGNIAQAHTADEWISLEQLEAGTATYVRFLEYWCGQS